LRLHLRSPMRATPWSLFLFSVAVVSCSSSNVSGP